MILHLLHLKYFKVEVVGLAGVKYESTDLQNLMTVNSFDFFKQSLNLCLLQTVECWIFGILLNSQAVHNANDLVNVKQAVFWP